MIEQADKLPEQYQKLIDAGVAGIDVIHGMLKLDMLEASARYDEAVKIEEANDYSDAMESMDRTRAEGVLDAYTHLYNLTYQLSFAIAEREAGK